LRPRHDHQPDEEVSTVSDIEDTAEMAEPDEQELLVLDQLVLERQKRKETIDAQTERVKQIDAILRSRLPHGHTQLGSTSVTITHGRRTINAERFAAKFPQAAFPECYRTTPAARTDVEKYVGSAILERSGVLDEGPATVQVR
jgi:hypothetical protein